MCGGGGGGDGGAGAARQQEAERQARIMAATDAINRIFSGSQRVTGTRVIPGTPGWYEPEYYNEAGEGVWRDRNRWIPGTPDRTETYKKWVAPVVWRDRNRWIPGTPDRTETYEKWVAPVGGNPREALYADQRRTVFDLNRLEVDRQAAEAERLNRFGLARAGLKGGSAHVDSTAEINRRTNEGLMRAGGIADQAAAELRAADEQARANLISLAQSGIDTGTAASQSLNALMVNNANAASARAGASLGGLFNDLSQAYLMHQANAGHNAARGQNAQQWYGVSNPRTGNAGRVTR